MTKREATQVRRDLDAAGFERVAGSGRGCSWTRHTKGSHGVFVQKVDGKDEWRVIEFTR